MPGVYASPARAEDTYGSSGLALLQGEAEEGAGEHWLVSPAPKVVLFSVMMEAAGRQPPSDATMKRYGDLWPTLISFDNLYLAYRKAIRGNAFVRMSRTLS